MVLHEKHGRTVIDGEHEIEIKRDINPNRVRIRKYPTT